MKTKSTDGFCPQDDLDRHLDRVLRLMGSLTDGGVICRFLLDFDADHVGLVHRTEPGRMRFYSVQRLFAQPFCLRAMDPGGRPAPAQTPWRVLVGIAALRRHQHRPLQQASIDLERGWATLRFTDGRIRCAALACLPTPDRPGQRLAS